MSWLNATAATTAAAPKLDLKLNLSPPRAENHREEKSPPTSRSMSPTASSCMSSESQEDVSFRRPGSPPETAATSMVLVGCPRCLMYVMLAEAKPMCPICKSSVLLDVIYEHNKNVRT